MIENEQKHIWGWDKTLSEILEDEELLDQIVHQFQKEHTALMDLIDTMDLDEIRTMELDQESRFQFGGLEITHPTHIEMTKSELLEALQEISRALMTRDFDGLLAMRRESTQIKLSPELLPAGFIADYAIHLNQTGSYRHIEKSNWITSMFERVGELTVEQIQELESLTITSGMIQRLPPMRLRLGEAAQLKLLKASLIDWASYSLTGFEFDESVVNLAIRELGEIGVYTNEDFNGGYYYKFWDTIVNVGKPIDLSGFRVTLSMPGQDTKASGQYIQGASEISYLLRMEELSGVKLVKNLLAINKMAMERKDGHVHIDWTKTIAHRVGTKYEAKILEDHLTKYWDLLTAYNAVKYNLSPVPLTVEVASEGLERVVFAKLIGATENKEGGTHGA